MDLRRSARRGSDNQYAKVVPLDKSQRQAAMLDPKTMKYTFVDTCFATHHLQFGYDADNTLWFSGTGPVAGWVNTKVLEETGDAEKAQGWAPWVLDTNGNGKLDEYVDPTAPADPAKDRRITAGSGPYSGHARSEGWFDLVRHRQLRGAACDSCASIRKQNYRRFITSRSRASASAVATSTATACCGIGLERSSDELRPQQVQRSARTGRQQPAIIVRRVGHSTNIPDPALRASRYQRRGELSHLGRSAQHAGPGRERSDLDRQPERWLRCVERRQDGLAAHPLPDRLLCQGPRRPHRRSECRLEGPRLVEHEWRSHASADGDRQGIEPARRAHPVPARPAGALTAERTTDNPAAPARGFAVPATRRALKAWSSIAANGRCGAQARWKLSRRELSCDTSYRRFDLNRLRFSALARKHRCRRATRLITPRPSKLRRKRARW